MAKKRTFAVGVDYGTNSVRTLIVDTADGREVATAVFPYPSGEAGILLDPKDPNLARQNPADYIDGFFQSVEEAVTVARRDPEFAVEDVVGVGVDTTGSTPLPVDAQGMPLAMKPAFRNNLAAQAWLWKDHTSIAEAAEITEKAKKHRDGYLTKCGGTYSSEWFWSKALHCKRTAPKVFAAAAAWVECADFIPAYITGNTAPATMPRGICAAGHKAMYHEQWGGLPKKAFLKSLDPDLACLGETFNKPALPSDCVAGFLTAEVAKRVRLPAGIPVAVGRSMPIRRRGRGHQARHAGEDHRHEHLRHDGRPGRWRVSRHPRPLRHRPRLDYPRHVRPGSGPIGRRRHLQLVCQVSGPLRLRGQRRHHRQSHRGGRKAPPRRKRPGRARLEQRQPHDPRRRPALRPAGRPDPAHHRPGDLPRLGRGDRLRRATIINRVEEYGVKVKEVINCGGIAEKSPMVMQIYADVCNRPMKISRSAQTCALGATIFGAVVGGADRDVPAAQCAMTGVKSTIFKPNKKAAKVYADLYTIYRQLHDAFGVPGSKVSLDRAMKDLIALRHRVRHEG